MDVQDEEGLESRCVYRNILHTLEEVIQSWRLTRRV